MQIKIYTKEKGLHNPYEQAISPFEFIVAEFLIDCIKEVERLFTISPEQLFGDVRTNPMSTIRGVLMVCYSEILSPMDVRFTVKAVAQLFRLDHSTFSRYRRFLRGSYPYFLKYYNQLSPVCQQVSKKHFPDGVILFTDKVYTLDDLQKLAAFLGHTKADVHCFLTQRT